MRNQPVRPTHGAGSAPEIYKVLNREGIEIPYPQSALHLRSVDRKVVSAFREPPECRPREVP